MADAASAQQRPQGIRQEDARARRQARRAGRQREQRLDHAGRQGSRLHGQRGLPAGRRRRPRRSARRARGRGDGDQLRAQGCRREHAPGVLRLQRRARFSVDLAPSRRAGSEARRDAQRRQHADGALCRGRQPAQLVRAFRPGLHRSAAYRMVDHGESRRAQEDALGRRRRRRADRRHAGVADAAQALGLARLPGRRELRHDARRGTRRQAAKRRRRAFRSHPDLVRDGSAEHRLLPCERSAVFAFPARVRQRLAISRAAEGCARQVARRRARRGRSLRERGLRRRAAGRRAPGRQGTQPHRAPHRRADGAAAGAGRGKEPAHQRTDLLLRGASSARPYRRPPRCARYRVRWPPAARASGSSIRASKPLHRRTRWRRWRTSASSSA